MDARTRLHEYAEEQTSDSDTADLIFSAIVADPSRLIELLSDLRVETYKLTT